MLSDEEIKTVKQEIALWQGKLYEIPVGQIEEEKDFISTCINRIDILKGLLLPYPF